MATPVDAKQRAMSTYNAAADFYDHPVNTFWGWYGQQTVSRLRLEVGAKILDVCCGSGASAIPAAKAVGPNGSVLGIDLSENLIELAKTKARERGLENIEFRVADMLDLDLAPSTFDVVICVFGIFFVPDMQQAIQTLWKLVRPGGQLAITTWGPRFFEPVNTAFWNAVRNERADLYKGFNPWDRISEPESLRTLLASTGAEMPEVVPENRRHRLRSPEDWWPMVLGTGYRGTIEQLDAAQREHVRNTASIMSALMAWNQSRLTCCMDWRRSAKRSCFTRRPVSAGSSADIRDSAKGRLFVTGPIIEQTDGRQR